jgi:MFS family permease
MRGVLRAGSARRLGILWSLYFVQGLPFGFQATALPVYLRSSGVSLAGVGLATALALPWSLKVFGAPFVDRFGSARFGQRRSWIAPLQLGLLACCAAAALVPPERSLAPILWLVLGMNLFAATMDIAVDGLAIDLLEPHELGQGNIAQVVGYKVGMLTGGGVLVWASGRIGWEGLFLAMAGLVSLCFVATLLWHERRLPRAGGHPPVVHTRLADVLALLRRGVSTSGGWWLLLFIGTYKLGETMADIMFKPFLVDHGFGPEQIGLWVGTWGMLLSIAGSIVGGFLAGRVPLLRAVGIAAALRVLAVGAEWWLSLVEVTPTRVVAVTCVEHFFAGLLTTAMFAYMMSRVDRRIGATHYTLLATIEVWGKLPAAALSGVVAQATGYVLLFGISTVLSAAFLWLLVPLARQRATAEPLAGPAAA